MTDEVEARPDSASEPLTSLARTAASVTAVATPRPPSI